MWLNFLFVVWVCCRNWNNCNQVAFIQANHEEKIKIFFAMNHEFGFHQYTNFFAAIFNTYFFNIIYILKHHIYIRVNVMHIFASSFSEAVEFSLFPAVFALAVTAAVLILKKKKPAGAEKK